MDNRAVRNFLAFAMHRDSALTPTSLEITLPATPPLSRALQMFARTSAATRCQRRLFATGEGQQPQPYWVEFRGNHFPAIRTARSSEVLSWYRKLLRLALSWKQRQFDRAEVTEERMVHERKYIKWEAARLFKRNKNVIDEATIAAKLQESEWRYELAVHYQIPYPREFMPIKGTHVVPPNPIKHSYDDEEEVRGKWHSWAALHRDRLGFDLQADTLPTRRVPGDGE
eukprot:TRINITY_DN4258_c0_g1_i1.p2 TRINITY_DN4258_c0_g1~~TRINITY_DN4258_c0_g1_i1.p2  ORF type:complete len:227 (+),score=43.57 TRINITY_DN4258_c0_g1_i1:607-1287(+)